MLKPYHTECYRGLHQCPNCGSLNTGTSTINTTERYVIFQCDDCSNCFQVSRAQRRGSSEEG